MVEVQEQFADRGSALPPPATTVGHPGPAVAYGLHRRLRGWRLGLNG